MSLKKKDEPVAAQVQKTDITAKDIKQTTPAKVETTAPAKKKGGFKAGLQHMGHGIAKWWRELKSELKKIVWPNRQTVMKNTGVVLMVIVVVGAAVWVMDAVFEYVILNGLLKLIAG